MNEPMNPSTARITWSSGFAPVGVVYILLAVVLGLVVALIQPVRGTAGEILFWTWPWFFGVGGIVCMAMAGITRNAPAQLGSESLSRGETAALVLAATAGVGYLIGVIVSLVVEPKTATTSSVQSVVWIVAGLGIGIVLGALAIPTLLNWIFFRLGLSRGFVTVADIVVFVIGVLGTVVVLREGLMVRQVGASALFIGALLASPIGLVLSHRILFGSRTR
jgi:hypothetical protein